MTTPITAGRTGQAVVVPDRRRVLAAVALLPAGGFVLSAWPRSAAAAAVAPSAIVDLDAAATSLFDAAEGRRWRDARSALTKAQAATRGAATLEGAFTEAGGELHRYFQAINNLSGDLIEARTALSVKDARWLVNAADRIAARAGELSQPFVQRSGTPAQRVEVLLFLARRMRRALVWSDDLGYRAAREDFRRLWQDARTQPPASPSAAEKALDDALARLSASNAASDARALQRAVESMRR